jgi:hypothetical protein
VAEVGCYRGGIHGENETRRRVALGLLMAVLQRSRTGHAWGDNGGDSRTATLVACAAVVDGARRTE